MVNNFSVNPGYVVKNLFAMALAKVDLTGENTPHASKKLNLHGFASF